MVPTVQNLGLWIRALVDEPPKPEDPGTPDLPATVVILFDESTLRMVCLSFSTMNN
jgi:hypothetical protein